MSEKLWEEDCVIIRGNEKRKVLSVDGIVLHLSEPNKFEKLSPYHFTQKELESNGWSKEEPLFECYIKKYKDGTVIAGKDIDSLAQYSGIDSTTIKVREVKE